MKKIKTISILTIFLLIGLGLNPITGSYEINKKTQTEDIFLTTSNLAIDDDKIDSLNEEELNLLIEYLSNILPSDIISDTTFEEIVNILKNMLNDNPTLLRKTFIISQGWSYNTNYFKNTKLQIKHDLLHFWHYSQASKNGRESKTFIIRSMDLLSSEIVELYSGKQTGIVFRPLGLYCFQKNKFPALSYTLFIGFASYVFINAQEEIQIPFPLSLV